MIWRRAAAIVLLAQVLTGCVTSTAPDEQRQEPTPAPTESGLFTDSSGARQTLAAEQWQTLQYTGEGSFRWPDGRLYSGAWRNSQPHGRGTMQHPDGARYSGQWLDGLPHGRGIQVAANGDRFEGTFEQGERHGQGQQSSADGVYRGQWQHNQPHGQGAFEGADGSLYRGAYHQGDRHGAGHFTSATGAVYDGDWLADEPSGFGVLIELDGGRREGQWRDGTSNGYGTYEHPAGLRYSGNWSADQRAGFGAEERPDGSRYEGNWVADQPQGQGILTHSDGRSRSGLWRAGLAHGSGTLTHPAGYTLTGQWQDDQLLGGTLTLDDARANASYSDDLLVGDNGHWQPGVHAWLHNHAEAGRPSAAWLLTERSSPGTDATAMEHARTLRNLALAAKANIALAQYELGKRLLDDDLRGALDWLNKAANATPGAGGAAHFLLGSLYHFGELVPQDQDQAESHYLAAIERGSIAAHRNLAAMLATTSIDYLRDPERALTILEPLALLYRSPGLLDALAVVYHANGRPADAAQTQQQALAALSVEAGSPEDSAMHAQIQAAMERRLSEYETAADPTP